MTTQFPENSPKWNRGCKSHGNHARIAVRATDQLMIHSLAGEKSLKPNFILIQAFSLLLALVLQCSARAELWTRELHGLLMNQKSSKCLKIHLPSPLGPPK